MERGGKAVVGAIEKLLDRGEPLLAYNQAQLGLEHAPDDIRLRQLKALSLARSGDVEASHRVLDDLVRSGARDAETMGMLARVHKDLALRAGQPEERFSHLRAGFDLYEQAYEKARLGDATADAYYTGINAATMAVLIGDLDRARDIARTVRDICLSATPGESPTARYWREATLGESALILGDNIAAAGHYASAARLADRRYGDVSSTRRQARLLAAHLPDADSNAAEALLIPPVFVFSGHMIDGPERRTERFPAALESRAREAIHYRLGESSAVAAYGSAACGADILCLEVVREMGGETHVVLPFPPEQFRAASVDFASGDWGRRFDRALADADSVTITSDHHATGSTSTFEYANLVLTGMGRLRAEVLDTQLRGLAVCDRSAAEVAGGTASILRLWMKGDFAIDRIHLDELRRTPSTSWAQEPQAPLAVAEMPHEIRAMLFADAVGYSKLSEDQIPRYVSRFLGAVAELSQTSAHRFEHVETAGDGLYMVFRDVADAAHFALELSALANRRDWSGDGLPGNFNLRIALHCGPVHCGTNPITGLPIYTGPHTSRAARIEPITPVGQVYASSAFAAVAAASRAGGLDMRYVGRIPLAKGYGSLELYHVAALPLTPAHTSQSSLVRAHEVLRDCRT